MILHPLFWDGLPPPNNEHDIWSRRPDHKKKKKTAAEWETLGTLKRIISTDLKYAKSVDTLYIYFERRATMCQMAG